MQKDNYNYEVESYCPKKGVHREQMHITSSGDNFSVILRHSFDGHGFTDNDYHIYSNKEITDGMEFRRRNDRWGDYYYIKLNREDTIDLFGTKSIDF